MLEKGIHIYEDDCNHIQEERARLDARPGHERWCKLRLLTQHWCNGICATLQKDLEPSDFEKFQASMRFGDALDDQLAGALQKWPATFNATMVPECKAIMELPENAQEEALRKAEESRWVSAWDLFRIRLQKDQQLLTKTRLGSSKLHDLMDYLEVTHKTQQGHIGAALVQQFLKENFPLAQCKDWVDLQAAIIAAQADSESCGPKCDGRRLQVIYWDLNAPHARDALIMQSLPGLCKNLVQSLGADKTVVMAIMPSQPKEDCNYDPVEDESGFQKAMRKQGFGCQQRCRMMLAQPPAVDAGDLRSRART